MSFDKQIPKKGDQRQMETWQRVGVYAAGLALGDAGIAGKAELLDHTDMIVAAVGGERDVAGRHRDPRRRAQGGKARALFSTSV